MLATEEMDGFEFAQTEVNNSGIDELELRISGRSRSIGDGDNRGEQRPVDEHHGNDKRTGPE